MKTKGIVFFAGVLSILCGCRNGSGGTGGADNAYGIEEGGVIKVELEPEKVSYKDLFKSCEVVRLETEPLSLLAGIDKAVCTGDSILLFDMKDYTVCLFAPDGSFLHRIGNRGDGPEDYLMCYDFSVNPVSREVSLLSSFGEIVNYTLGGKYAGREKLPSKPNYMACAWMDGDEIALWSAVESDEAGVSVANVPTGKTVYEDWHNDRMIDMCRMNPFFDYDGDVFFAAPLTNRVYRLGDTGMDLAYEWNFGFANLPESYIEEVKALESPSERNRRLIGDMKSGDMKYHAEFNGETGRYVYVMLQTGLGEDAEMTSVFHDKKTGSNTVFTGFSEGLSFIPLYMNDDYVLCRIPYEEVEAYNRVFGLHHECGEEDNPLLARFYFRK